MAVDRSISNLSGAAVSAAARAILPAHLRDRRPGVSAEMEGLVVRHQPQGGLVGSDPALVLALKVVVLAAVEVCGDTSSTELGALYRFATDVGATSDVPVGSWLHRDRVAVWVAEAHRSRRHGTVKNQRAILHRFCDVVAGVPPVVLVRGAGPSLPALTREEIDRLVHATAESSGVRNALVAAIGAGLVAHTSRVTLETDADGVWASQGELRHRIAPWFAGLVVDATPATTYRWSQLRQIADQCDVDPSSLAVRAVRAWRLGWFDRTPAGLWLRSGVWSERAIEGLLGQLATVDVNEFAAVLRHGHPIGQGCERIERRSPDCLRPDGVDREQTR